MEDGGEEPGAPTTGLLLLFGAASCVGCLAALAFAATAVLGVSVVPPALLGTTTETLALSAVLLVVLGVYGVRSLRRETRRRERGAPPDPYWTFDGRRTAASLLLGAVAVVALALAAKLLVESLTDMTYTIHWLRTVPLLAVGAGWFIQGEWNRRVRDRAAGDGD